MTYSLLLNMSDGISCDSTSMVNGTCTFDINASLGIRESVAEESVGLFVQDATLAATTSIGIVIVIGRTIAALMMIAGGVFGKQDRVTTGSKSFGYGFVAFLLVAFAYVIIRLVQFIVRG